LWFDPCGDNGQQSKSLKDHESKQGLVLDPSVGWSNQVIEKVVHDDLGDLVQDQDSERDSEVENRVQGGSHWLLQVVVQKDVHGWGEELGSEEVHQHVVELHQSSHEGIIGSASGVSYVNQTRDQKDEGQEQEDASSDELTVPYFLRDEFWLGENDDERREDTNGMP
jgi:hypothetical protein